LSCSLKGMLFSCFNTIKVKFVVIYQICLFSYKWNGNVYVAETKILSKKIRIKFFENNISSTFYYWIYVKRVQRLFFDSHFISGNPWLTYRRLNTFSLPIIGGNFVEWTKLYQIWRIWAKCLSQISRSAWDETTRALSVIGNDVEFQVGQNPLSGLHVLNYT